MIKVEWGNPEKDIIIWTFISHWNFEEFYAAQARAVEMIDSVENEVDTIFLAGLEQTIPVQAVTHLRKIAAQRHKRLRYIVIVGAKSFLDTLLNMITELVPDFGRHMHRVRTQAEAFTLIAKLRTTIPQSVV